MALTRLKEGGNTYRAEMDAHERASRDEIMALQTQRLAWSLKHAYDNVAHYRKAFDTAGVHPSEFRELSDLAKFPIHGEDGPARQLSLQHVCRAP
ncbi:phenylacetate-coenzyme A ligase PaaK-like adenylate-forming protein [Bradyrhizobium sp. LB1.3]